MCILLLLHRVVPDFPTVLAANRDEYFARSSRAPEIEAARIPFLAPRDLEGGGTWIGTNAAGLSAAITNRREEERNASLPSRGRLVHEALSLGNAAAARIQLGKTLGNSEENGFNLLYTDGLDAYVTRGGAGTKLETLRLEPGAHIVTNDHEVDELPLTTVETIAREADTASLVATVSNLIEFLGQTEPESGTDFAPCKKFADRGTRSATVIARGEPSSDGAHGGLYLHADGPPDGTVFEDYGALLRQIIGPERGSPRT